MLNLATDGNSPVHYAKGTPSPLLRPKAKHRAPTACRCMVSGPFNSPNRGSFHRSLALLSTIGRWRVFSLGRWTSRIQTTFHVCGLTRGHHGPFLDVAYGAVTRYGSASNGFRYQSMYHCVGPTTPGSMPPGLGFSLFARRYWGNRVFFLLLRLLRCFS